ncbi:MAG: HAMP domain-containing histidine kinase [Patescibacteria group bacterium]|nr:HAMP domain-containing histidine kinase [Patescibacteria group bacterium]
MFRSARIILTAWYALSILIVSLVFSGIIYRASVSEIERFERMQRFRLERSFAMSDTSDRPMRRFLNRGGLPPPSPELLVEARRRILLILVMINGGIVMLGAGLGYFLAGRTLAPIQRMVRDQKRFVSDASHELRTPLTALKSSLEVFLRERSHTKADAYQLVKDALKDVSRLQTLTESLLELARTEFSTAQRRKRVSLRSILQAAVNQVSRIAHSHTITIHDFEGEVFVYGNQEELTRVFEILLENAVKYSPNGKPVTIDTVLEPTRVSVSVTDHGIGIDPQDLPHIFKRFYRADRARTSGAGFGLGLAIARQIVEAHSGTIQAMNVDNGGARFTVTLPRSAPLQNLVVRWGMKGGDKNEKTQI